MERLNDPLPGGGHIAWMRFTPEEIEAAWTTDGQGHAGAVARGPFCVVVRAGRWEAIVLSAICLRAFTTPTCATWDGFTFSFNCSEAGHGAQDLKRRVAGLVADALTVMAEGGVPRDDLFQGGPRAAYSFAADPAAEASRATRVDPPKAG